MSTSSLSTTPVMSSRSAPYTGRRENGVLATKGRDSEMGMSCCRADTTVRGVITAVMVTDPKRKMLRMIRDSCSSRCPDRSPIPAMAMNSSRLKVCCFFPREISRVTPLDNQTRG